MAVSGDRQGEAGGPARPSIAFGPELPGWGSWEWVGLGLRDGLAGRYGLSTFAAWEDTAADVAVVVKHLPPPDWVADRLARGTTLIYCPIDFYGDAAAIDGDAAILRRMGAVVIHAERLRRYFAPYSPVVYLDHAVRFAAPLRERFQADGPILWVGVRTNLPPLVAWVNRHGVPGRLDVLTNFEDPARPPTARDLGFRAALDVQVHPWCPHRHAELTASARAVIDIKGDDFRSRHKPPAKGIDVLASGVPLAMNPDSSTVEHLAGLGFDVADPLDRDHWLSPAYWEETRRFGGALHDLLTDERIAFRFARIVEAARAAQRSGAAGSRRPA